MRILYFAIREYLRQYAQRDICKFSFRKIYGLYAEADKRE